MYLKGSCCRSGLSRCHPGGNMYAEFYRLKEMPFALTPDPRYIYFTPSHTEVMANLHYGVESGKGLIAVTGEVGPGKTTILSRSMQRTVRTVRVAYALTIC